MLSSVLHDRYIELRHCPSDYGYHIVRGACKRLVEGDIAIGIGVRQPHLRRVVAREELKHQAVVVGEDAARSLVAVWEDKADAVDGTGSS